VDDQRLAAAVRAIRLRRRWTQHELAAAARISQSTVSRVERGHLDSLPLATIRRVTSALDVRVDLRVRWRGGDLDRLLDRDHAALGEAVVAWLAESGWEGRPEISFSRYGERGSIDILARHAVTGSLLVIELKTVLVDLQDMIASVDRKRRLATHVAESLGWSERNVSSLVVIADGRTNRRRVAEHQHLLHAAFPLDGRGVRLWIRHPVEPMRGLMIWPLTHRWNARQRVAGSNASVPPDPSVQPG